MERTLVLVKPDAMERKLMGDIISIYEKKGLHIVALKIIKPSVEMAENHYYQHKGKPFFKELVNFITRSEVCAMIIEADDVVSIVRKINGATDPMEADMGTIRGKFSTSKTENSVHSSDSYESFKDEVKIWFPELIKK